MGNLLSIPRHIAIIMDGNNRWAQKKLLPRIAGHKAGVDSVRAVVEVCAKEGVEVLTLFAFSSENWQRPANEVQALMKLFLWALQQEVKKLKKYGVRLKIIGDRSAFSKQLQDAMQKAEDSTCDGDGVILQVAANYGGQWDIVQATQNLAKKVAEGSLTVDEITAERFGTYLSTSTLPLPDLCIRTGGEYRISNFLLWQLAYTELYFSDIYWPDFRHEAMYQALEDYAVRQRRFGKTADQIEKEI